MDYKLAISIVSLVFSAVALYFTFKKDSHRVRILGFESMPSKYMDLFSINNDSSFPITISAILHISHNGKITKMEKCFKYIENERLPIPYTIQPRSTLRAGAVSGVIPSQKQHSYGVQLDCGRTFYVSGNLPPKVAIKFKLKEVLSRLTSGKYGTQRYLYPDA